MKKEMLKKMQMPKKPMAEEEAEMDLGLEMGDMEDMPMEPEMPMPEGEEEMAEGEISPLADLGDEEIINELKSRGLSLDDIKAMFKEEAPEEAEEEMV